MANRDEEKGAAFLSKALALTCVRNTYLEELHAGTVPSSQTGDYSDVKVVTPFGEIPWTKLSRISDAEMKRLMKEVVNKLYTFLLRQRDDEFAEALGSWARKYIGKWDEPEFLPHFVTGKPYPKDGGSDLN
jgi:hypothetical protein